MKNLKTEGGKQLFLYSGLLFASVLVSCSKKPAQPNILFIASDDLNTDIGCYGADQVKT